MIVFALSAAASLTMAVGAAKRRAESSGLDRIGWSAWFVVFAMVAAICSWAALKG